MLDSKEQELIRGKILQQINKTMFKSYNFLHVLVLQIESYNFQISTCAFDRNPTITSGGPTSLQLPPNVEHILYPKALRPYRNKKLGENPIQMAIVVLVFNWYTVLLLKWYDF